MQPSHSEVAHVQLLSTSHDQQHVPSSAPGPSCVTVCSDQLTAVITVEPPTEPHYALCGRNHRSAHCGHCSGSSAGQRHMAYACDVCRALPYLGFIHSDQALVDLGPVGDSADVPQLIGVLCERTRLHLQRDKRGGGTTVL